eukprot:3416141-Prymnesium_polylepis.1
MCIRSRDSRYRNFTRHTSTVSAAAAVATARSSATLAAPTHPRDQRRCGVRHLTSPGSFSNRRRCVPSTRTTPEMANRRWPALLAVVARAPASHNGPGGLAAPADPRGPPRTPADPLGPPRTPADPRLPVAPRGPALDPRGPPRTRADPDLRGSPRRPPRTLAARRGPPRTHTRGPLADLRGLCRLCHTSTLRATA